MNRIDVVIPISRVRRELQSILDHLVAEGLSVSCYVVTDDVVDDPIVGALPVQVVRSKGVGAEAARNTGIEAGTGDFILFIDDDVVPSPNLFQSYKTAIEKWPDTVGFVGLVAFPGCLKRVW